MAQIYVKYNPYKMQTDIAINGKDIPVDSSLYTVVKGKRLQEWVGHFPQMLVKELNTVDFDVEFKGMDLDYDDFKEAFNHAREDGTLKKFTLKFIEGKTNVDVNDKIVQIFKDLQDGPVEEFKDPKLERAFISINNSEFPINVIATMSSGKSTLINALLCCKLMPSKNEACTATITEILDNDDDHFEAVVCDKDGNVIEEISNLTYEEMDRLNSNENVHKIEVEGDIPFLDARSTALKLVDTPGPNNSQNQEHKNTTFRAINNDANNLILYVLNGTQLSTNDDASLLSYVAEQIKKGGKQVRDRFLFVINKMDCFNPEEEDIGEAIGTAKQYLAKYGIDDPQIYPCSAFTALNIRTCLDGINIDNLTRAEEKQLPSAARDSLPMIDKFNEYEQMYLEQYSTLSPSAQSRINFELSKAEKNNDSKAQALIHCGIRSIEEAITAYVKKYARTKKIKDLVESFREVLESSQVLTKAKTQVATSEEAAKELEERAKAVTAKIDDGKHIKEFKKKIEALDPMPSIKKKADKLKANAVTKTTRVFEPYGDTITSKSEAKNLVLHFTDLSSDSIAEITTELDSAINREIIDTGKKLLEEYQAKLSQFDEESGDRQLDFGSADLIRGALNNMRENAARWSSGEFAAKTVDNYGKTTTEEKVYYEKTGQQAEKVADGTEQVKVGKKKVQVGTKWEKTGETRTVKNPDRHFWNFLWTPKFVEEDVYENVPQYEDQDVYETQIKYKTIMRDVYEERIEKVEKFSAKTAEIQAGLIRTLRSSLDNGINNALDYAEKQTKAMKAQFSQMFDELDELIKAKYAELEKCAGDKKTKDEELKKNKKILEWIEACSAEIDDVLEI